MKKLLLFLSIGFISFCRTGYGNIYKAMLNEADMGSDSAKNGGFRRHALYAELPVFKVYQAFWSHGTGFSGLMKGYGIGYGYQLKGGGELFAGLNAYFVPDRFGVIPPEMYYRFSNSSSEVHDYHSPYKTGPNFFFTVQKRFYLFKKFRLQPFFSLGLSQYVSYAAEAVQFSGNQTTIEKINAWTGLSGWHYGFGVRYQYKQFGISIWGSIHRFYQGLSWTSTQKYSHIFPDALHVIGPFSISLSYSF